ncbi:hypothetical protein VTJ49DRAFT_6636 [Mycothermus thermophilus]|uniref:DUF7136 domain-containing protein n=1 Tax=Humicola insolens TaxID=85995 RepID=A0ABR3V181_HUMIN
MSFPRRLLAALLGSALYGSAARADDITYPVTVSASLVFPHNDTYAPGPMFPMVWAIHNLHAALPSSAMRLHYRITALDEPFEDWVVYSDFDLERYVTSNGGGGDKLPNPFYLTTYTPKLNTTATAGRYALFWQLTATSCYPFTEAWQDGVRDRVNWINFSQTQGTHFTIADPSNTTTAVTPKNPMDISADQASTCANWSALSFAITDTVPVPEADDDEVRKNRPNQTLCAIIPDPTPGIDPWGYPETTTTTTTSNVPAATTTVPPNPCLGKMDAAAAESLSSKLTSMGCKTWLPDQTPLITEGCPAPTTNAAAPGAALFGSTCGGVAVVGLTVGWTVVGGLLFAAL